MDKYVRAQVRIVDGLWTVDAEGGQVYNHRGKALGSLTQHGYVFLVMSPAPGGRGNQNVYAHRVIWEATHGPIPEGLQVNHINGIKSDNGILNLELVTPSGNMQHAHRMGLAFGAGKGEAHHAAKLTADQVRTIRERVANGERQAVVATDVGLSRGHVNRIVRRQNWTDLDHAA